MSYVSTFGFSNKSEATTTITPYDLQVLDNYALKQDEPEKVILDNKTCPLDKPEVLSYGCQEIKNVNTSIDVQHPSAITRGIQYTAKLEELLTTTSDTDSSYRVDEPVVVTLTVRHQKSGNISNDLVGMAVRRLIGACLREDGSWRFDDLMRNALKPTEN